MMYLYHSKDEEANGFQQTKTLKVQQSIFFFV